MDQESEFFDIAVDGRAITVRSGQPLPQALDAAGVYMPHLCYHPSLGPIQTCDTCFVEVDGNLVRGCSVVVKPGMEIGLNVEEAESARMEAIHRVTANHDLYCSVCDNNNGDCAVHNTVRDMHVPGQHYAYRGKPYEKDYSNPFYIYDPDQCILCGRCVEACQNLQVNETLSIDWERERPRVIWDEDVAIEDSSCVSCGHCVTVCPCNALMEKTALGKVGPMTALSPQAPDGYRRLGRASIDLVKAAERSTGFGPIFAVSEVDSAMRETELKRTKTVCTYCGVGCSFEMWTRGRDLLKVQPKAEAPANGISTCIKGKFGWGHINSEHRLTKPLIRENGSFREAEWDEAYRLIARRFNAIRDAHGPDALAFIASSKCTNEEAYLMQKFARSVIGTNNIDNCSRYCQAPATEGLWRTMGYGADTGGIADLEAAELLLIVGSNTAESHPVIATRMKRAAKLHGQKHIVADLRKNEMAERADLFMRPEPGTDLIWMNAVSKYIVDNGHAAEDFIAEHVDSYEDFKQSLAPFTLEFAEQRCGLGRDTLMQVIEMILAADTVCGVWAMGVTQHSMGADTATALCNLLIVTGNIAKFGAGAFPMRGHNNVQGASDFGCMPSRFPGYDFVTEDDVRKRYEQVWGTELTTRPGLNNHEMVHNIHDGELKSLYVVGEDMAIVDSDALNVQSAFEKLEFFVVQDMFFSRTCEFADVVLPASPSLEKEGTFTNTERRLQRLYEVFPPLGDSKPDWRIHTELAAYMGHDWGYTHPSEIMHEAAGLTDLFTGVHYDRLQGFDSQQWPVAADGTSEAQLYSGGSFHFGDGKARLYPVHWNEPTDQPDREYDLHLNNGRLLEHFHEGNLTDETPGIVYKIPHGFVEVSPQLAEERGLESGRMVRLKSRRGAVKVAVQVTDRVSGKQLYMPQHGKKNIEAVNVLTSFQADKDTDTPAYKECAVNMQALDDHGPAPLKPNNQRHKKRHPTSGVQVDRKWERDDYRRPPKVRPTGSGI
ncbi:formate dehydrogenase subunit alpha [Salinisphaera sp.]|uniref:formate dehydrogenase subunit alpha n=1 Tax=Salinisphaera sp. TaxID=1914330 RepID=UPI002D7703E3|nr:formate dehydrogenase subunit alpha [Salinisphaera sp.]HET7312773.1 formate dehydrogenase subunit alpha [Salinisphaera sp.]